MFTQFRATQDMLAGRLQAARHDVALFHGGLTRLAKEAAVVRFRGPARILLASDAGSEGRNLQFAHAICNYDLPWNPMRIEQRIGRLSRIGQTSDVQVYNLVASGTIEAAVLHLLEAKLNLFELVIGEIDMILGNLDEEREFEESRRRRVLPAVGRAMRSTSIGWDTSSVRPAQWAMSLLEDKSGDRRR